MHHWQYLEALRGRAVPRGGNKTLEQHVAAEGRVGTLRMRSLFARRERDSRNAGQLPIWFADSVRALEAYEGLHCVIAYIDDRPRGGYFFQLFLTPDLSEMITCFGVKPVPEKKDAPSDIEK
jgi:hypothetical protein